MQHHFWVFTVSGKRSINNKYAVQYFYIKNYFNY